MIFNYLNIVFEVTAHLFRAAAYLIFFASLAIVFGYLAYSCGLENLFSYISAFLALAFAYFAGACAYTEVELVADDIRAWRN